MTKGAGQATKSLNVDVLDNLDDAHSIAVDWHELAASQACGPFSHPAFALPWWQHLGRGELVLVAARDNSGQLVGVAPLHERRMGSTRVLRWLGHGLGTTGELVVRAGKADVAGALWSAVAERGNNRVLELVEYRHGGQGLAELRGADNWSVHAELRGLCPTIALSEVESATDFLAVPERRGIRKKLAKMDRAIDDADSELSTRVCGRTADEIADTISAIEPVNRAAEDAYPRLDLLSGPYRPFLIDAFIAAAEHGSLAVLVLELDGEPIAFDVYLRSGAAASAWLGRYDPDAASWSPGHLLLRSGVEWAIAEEIETIDLQLGGDEYKMRWSTGSYDTLSVIGASGARALTRARGSLWAVTRAHSARSRLRR